MKLKEEYERLFDSCQVRDGKLPVVERIIGNILKNKKRYEEVGRRVRIPWYFIAVIHNMEGGLNFNTHLHNGDPLTKRTQHIPRGRPKSGIPPFTWEESSIDALEYEKLNRWKDWSIGGTLYKLEKYNGWGYRSRHPHVLSPYLWSFSNHYSKGKYVADGRWSESAVSQQAGAAVILRRMAEMGVIDLEVDKTPPPKILYSKSKTSSEARRLQVFLNTFWGIYLKEDGVPGPKTSEAFMGIFGSYLEGDPRG